MEVHRLIKRYEWQVNAELQYLKVWKVKLAKNAIFGVYRIGKRSIGCLPLKRLLVWLEIAKHVTMGDMKAQGNKFCGKAEVQAKGAIRIHFTGALATQRAIVKVEHWNSVTVLNGAQLNSPSLTIQSLPSWFLRGHHIFWAIFEFVTHI